MGSCFVKERKPLFTLTTPDINYIRKQENLTKIQEKRPHLTLWIDAYFTTPDIRREITKPGNNKENGSYGIHGEALKAIKEWSGEISVKSRTK